MLLAGPNARFTGDGGELRTVTSNGQLIVLGDTDGDKVADVSFAVAPMGGGR